MFALGRSLRSSESSVYHGKLVTCSNILAVPLRGATRRSSGRRAGISRCRSNRPRLSARAFPNCAKERYNHRRKRGPAERTIRAMHDPAASRSSDFTFQSFSGFSFVERTAMGSPARTRARACGWRVGCPSAQRKGEEERGGAPEQQDPPPSPGASVALRLSARQKKAPPGARAGRGVSFRSCGCCFRFYVRSGTGSRDGTRRGS